MSESTEPPEAESVPAEVTATELTEVQKRRASARSATAAWFNAHWPGKLPCPFCNPELWTWGDVCLSAVRDADPPRRPGGPVETYAFVPLACDTCGYTMFFNAV